MPFDPTKPANNSPASSAEMPALSVDQFAATLGHWFGVSDSELATVLPNLVNYSDRNLGFLV